MYFRSFFVLGALVVLAFGASARAADADFSAWLEDFKPHAQTQGVSPQTLEEALAGLEPDDEVIALDRKQPENKITLTQYLARSVSKRRIARGRALMHEHAAALKRISKRYGVPAKYIVALWGIESDYGAQKGNFSVIQSLATLAYEGRRAEFFGGELLAALKILDSGAMPPDALTGSWAGAMGDCQFMPSTYLKYAVDADGDGARDIWNSPADTFASIAHYLHALGWNRHQHWGAPVTVPGDFSATQTNINRSHPGDYWRKTGLVYAPSPGGEGARLRKPRGKIKLYAIYPGEEEEGVYLVSENFKALLNWNRSRYFATAVGTLADALEDTRP